MGTFQRESRTVEATSTFGLSDEAVLLGFAFFWLLRHFGGLG